MALIRLKDLLSTYVGIFLALMQMSAVHEAQPYVSSVSAALLAYLFCDL